MQGDIFKGVRGIPSNLRQMLALLKFTEDPLSPPSTRHIPVLSRMTNVFLQGSVNLSGYPWLLNWPPFANTCDWLGLPRCSVTDQKSEELGPVGLIQTERLSHKLTHILSSDRNVCHSVSQ